MNDFRTSKDTRMNTTLKLLFTCLLLPLSLSSCTKKYNNLIDSGIKYMVTAEHSKSEFSSILDDGFMQFYDGNEISYETHWKSKNDFADFSDVKTECTNKFKITKQKDPWILPSEIDTSLFPVNIHRPIVTCIIEKGYELIDSGAFFPRSYEISMSRSHTDRGRMLGVGFRYRVTKLKTNYSSLMNDIKNCHHKVYQKYGVEEKYLGHSISVSVKKYSNEIAKCFFLKNYKVERLN